jgi:hypothetical protein
MYAYSGIASGLKGIMPQALKPLLMFSAVMEALLQLIMDNKIEVVANDTADRVVALSDVRS